MERVQLYTSGHVPDVTGGEGSEGGEGGPQASQGRQFSTQASMYGWSKHFLTLSAEVPTACWQKSGSSGMFLFSHGTFGGGGGDGNGGGGGSGAWYGEGGGGGGDVWPPHASHWQCDDGQ